MGAFCDSITGALVGIIGGLALIVIILAGMVAFFISQKQKRMSGLVAATPQPFDLQALVTPRLQPRQAGPVDTMMYNTPFSKQSIKRFSVSGIDA